MFVPNLHIGQPTISQAVLAFREGKPESLFRNVSREDVLAAARERGIDIRNGRLQLPYGAERAMLVFGMRDVMEEAEHGAA